MGLKGAVPYFQRSLQTKILHGLVYIDDVLTHGKTDPEFLANTRRVLDSLRNTKIAVNQDWVSRRSNTLVTSFPRRAPHSPQRST